MGATAEKLDYLARTKELIAAAIEAQGVDISDEDTFRSYVEKILTIGKLPAITDDDNGKVLTVADGKWTAAEAVKNELPAVSSADNRKVPQIVNGAFEYVDVARLKMADGRTLTEYITDLINMAIGGGFVPPDVSDEPDVTSSYLKSLDGHVLVDVNEKYLIPKEID